MFKIYSEEWPFEVNEEGIVRNRFTGHVYKPRIVKDYLKVATTYKGKKWGIPVHRLVAICFVPNPSGKDQVNHKDGNKLNNCASNLEWVTTQENRAHAFDTGLQKGLLGDKNGRSKITEEDARKVCELLVDGFRPKDIEDRTGISRSIPRDIKKGLSWRHLASEYGIPVTWELGFSAKTAKWVCCRLEEGMQPIDIQRIARSARVTIEKIKLIRDRKAYVNISKHYNF